MQKKPIILTQKGDVLKMSTEIDMGIMVRAHMVPKKQEKPWRPLRMSSEIYQGVFFSQGFFFITHIAIGAEQRNIIVHLNAA
jgi:hypothetical protein